MPQRATHKSLHSKAEAPATLYHSTQTPPGYRRAKLHARHAAATANEDPATPADRHPEQTHSPSPAQPLLPQRPTTRAHSARASDMPSRQSLPQPSAPSAPKL